MKNIDLNSINSPADIRSLDLDSLRGLAAEMRSALLHKLSATGGHVGPNLGMIEATIALHYVFNTPVDKLIFDVSHQSYPHKMLTGRMKAYTEPDRYGTVTGFTNPDESPYDLFTIGHTSTSLALACGMAKARDLAGDRYNVVALIGDGSLGGGEALEGLNFGAVLGSNFIVVVNDNDMSIAENHGGLYADLRLLRHSNGTAEPNIFRAMGYAYRYVHYGNDLRSLINMFESVKDIDHPVVVHINTMKGMGLPAAESDKERFHYCAPFDLGNGAPLHQSAAGDQAEDYTDIFAMQMLEAMDRDSRIAVLNAGTPAAVGFTPERRRAAGRRFIDVGIAEQMCVGMTAGMAKAGARPVMAVVSSFIQRAYDQISQDAALNHLPAVYNIFHTGVYAMNDNTHLGFFDIAMLSNIPEVNFLAPTCRREYTAMLRWAVEHTEQTTVLRTPGGAVVDDAQREILDDYSKPRFEVARTGKDGIALIGVGNFFYLMQQAADMLKAAGIDATLINPRCLSSLDTDSLENLKGYKLIVTAEDGIVDGGFGQKVAAYMSARGVETICLGLPKKFVNRFKSGQLMESCGLTPSQITSMVQQKLSK